MTKKGRAAKKWTKPSDRPRRFGHFIRSSDQRVHRALREPGRHKIWVVLNDTGAVVRSVPPADVEYREI